MVVSFKKINIIFLLILAIFITGCQLKDKISPLNDSSTTVEKIDKPLKDDLPSNTATNSVDNSKLNKIANSDKEIGQNIFWHLKDIPLDISDAELDQIQALGFSVLMPEWGVGDATINEVKNLLDRLAVRNLKIVLDGGFSAGALGFHDDGSDPENQKPVWQKEIVTAWINALKNHPAVYGWDISNEAGENVPNGDRFKVTLNNLITISREVRLLDNNHPILLRMHYWDEYDGDFGLDNPFEQDLADIVILNLYSNYSEDGTSFLLPDMLAASGQRLINKIKSVDPQVNIWLSLSAFTDLPMFPEQTVAQLANDITAAKKLSAVESLGFFGWGEKNSNWYLPRDGALILKTISQYIK